MNRVLLIATIILLRTSFVSSQEIYLKAGSSFHLPTTTQQMPKYFGISYTWFDHYHLNVNRFSLAKGLSFDGSIGYSFNSFISCELLLSYYKNYNKEFTTLNSFDEVLDETNWDYSDFRLLPTVLIGQSFNKSDIKFFAYSGVGLNNLNIRASLGQNFWEYKLNGRMSFTWGYGIEYVIKKSSKIEFFYRLGINNTYYTPKRAKLVSSSFPLEHYYYSSIFSEIEYVNSEMWQVYDYNKPQIRLKETLRLNSIYLKVGIIYTLSKK